MVGFTEAEPIRHGRKHRDQSTGDRRARAGGGAGPDVRRRVSARLGEISRLVGPVAAHLRRQSALRPIEADPQAGSAAQAGVPGALRGQPEGPGRGRPRARPRLFLPIPAASAASIHSRSRPAGCAHRACGTRPASPWRTTTRASSRSTIGNQVYFRSADGTFMPMKKDQSPPDLKVFQAAAELIRGVAESLPAVAPRCPSRPPARNRDRYTGTHVFVRRMASLARCHICRTTGVACSVSWRCVVAWDRSPGLSRPPRRPLAGASYFPVRWSPVSVAAVSAAAECGAISTSRCRGSELWCRERKPASIRRRSTRAH